jgi:SAM-dependent methyltransferase
VPLELATVTEEESGVIVEGVLHCGADTCLQEYPIIDAIPIIVPNVRSYLFDNLFHVMQRHDRSAVIESLLGDAAGPGSAYDATRQHLSTYGWDHYHEFAPPEWGADERAGAVSRCLEHSLNLVGDSMSGNAIDVGCSVGRATFDLAQRTDGLVLGVDVNFSMLQVAQTVLRTGEAHYPLRRVGVVYDRCEFPVQFAGVDRVDFWACDALALPFPSQSFSCAVALNVLDCVVSPRGFLDSVADILAAGGSAVFSTPYDWSGTVTPIEAWIGGHSQRGPDHGASEPLLRSLLTPGAHPQASDRLRLTAELQHVPWRARLHDRSVVEYTVHVVAAELHPIEHGENIQSRNSA